MEEINSPCRNSRLFSHDFLEEHLPTLPEWQIHKDELKAAREKLQSLFEQALPATSEAALEEELIRPILGEVLGFSYLVQPSTAVFKTHRQPDYTLFLSEEEKQGAKAFDREKKLFEDALAVADAKSWSVDLDAVGPASQMHNYIWSSLRKNKSRIGRNLTPTFMQEVRSAYEDSLAELLPIKERLRLTDALIDQIVYRLYNLTEAEIDIVEDKALLRQGIPNQPVDKT